MSCSKESSDTDDEDDSLFGDQRNDDDDNGDDPYYLTKIQELLIAGGQQSLDLDTMHLLHGENEFNELYKQLVKYPMEIVPMMDAVCLQTRDDLKML